MISFSTIAKEHKNILNKITRNAMYLIGNDIVREIKNSMEQEKSGRTYKINGQYHVSSAPYESPAIITGKLQRSIKANVHNFNKIIIGSNVKYARFLELGTKKMLPRPFIKPAIYSQRKNLINYFTSVKNDIR